MSYLFLWLCKIVCNKLFLTNGFVILKLVYFWNHTTNEDINSPLLLCNLSSKLNAHLPNGVKLRVIFWVMTNDTWIPCFNCTKKGNKSWGGPIKLLTGTAQFLLNPNYVQIELLWVFNCGGLFNIDNFPISILSILIDYWDVSQLLLLLCT